MGGEPVEPITRAFLRTIAEVDERVELSSARLIELLDAEEERDRLRTIVDTDRQRIWHGIESWEERGAILNADNSLTPSEHTHKPLSPFFAELCALVFHLDVGEGA